ncbi:hypothetical protein ARMA_3064 [Ardenticatena maritima]|uniref:Glutaredoxin n=1 Tax=Ardenticatena maritima TaxID=872965 RepID=A0A0M8KB59_9CHLR|nr:thioredoxin family protein [Ardenticatena maritima]KPL87223.1 glutaredoxin [Ardenticatena maritima]GAP64641.1 hypothetical protein ARMA_3064 [Ardenticatena maritima]
MPKISAKDRAYLQEAFASLTQPVTLLLFTSKEACPYCNDTREILEELAELSDNITVDVRDMAEHAADAEAYGVDKAPATIVLGNGTDYGIRYYGIPAGYEFASLVEDVLMVGQGQSKLSEATKEALRNLQKPVHIQVFVTPTCPYCPQAVSLAHQMAFESPLVRADMVEAMEFPELADRYNVMGVPRIVINEDWHIEGAVPEEYMLQGVLQAVGEAVA